MRIYKVVCELVSKEGNAAELDIMDERPCYTRNDAIVIDHNRVTEPYDYPGVSEAVSAEQISLGADAWNKKYSPIGAPDPGAEAMVQLGLIVPFPQLQLEMVVAPPSADATRTTNLVGQTAFEMDGYTLRVEKVDFSAVSTAVRFTVTPNPPRPIKPPARNASDNDPLFRGYKMLDEKGVELSERGLSSTWRFDFEATDAEGSACIRYSYLADPLEGDPLKTLTILPTDKPMGAYDEQMYQEWLKTHCCMDEAVTVGLG